MMMLASEGLIPQPISLKPDPYRVFLVVYVPVSVSST